MAPFMQPGPEPVAAEPAGTGRPYQDYVESEARKYWEEMVNPGSLAKPGQEEIRAAGHADPVRSAAQEVGLVALVYGPSRRRSHATACPGRNAGSGRPTTRLAECPGYVEALIQLRTTPIGWPGRSRCRATRRRSIPPIYYTIDPASKRTVPRSDALISGNYVYETYGRRLTPDDHIYPWPDPEIWPMLDDLASRQWTACYSVHLRYDGHMHIMIHWERCL